MPKILSKEEIKTAWELTFRRWQNDEDDQRDPFHDLPVDFAATCVQNTEAALKGGIKNTIQSLSVMLADPLLPRDQKDHLRGVIDANKKLIGESEVICD